MIDKNTYFFTNLQIIIRFTYCLPTNCTEPENTLCLSLFEVRYFVWIIVKKFFPLQKEDTCPIQQIRF